jgi:hypothetical protein
MRAPETHYTMSTNASISPTGIGPNKLLLTQASSICHGIAPSAAIALSQLPLSC